jgi:purine-binding chemotaxis protein CheW
MLNPMRPGQRILIFRLSGHICAFALENVSEVVPMARLACPPGMPTPLQGLLNLGGTMIPVIRLDRIFSLTEQNFDLYTPLVITQINENCAAFMVNAVTGVTAFSASVAIVESQHTFNGCTEAVIKIGEETVHLLSVHRILLQEERQCIEEFAAREQQRLSALNGSLS